MIFLSTLLISVLLTALAVPVLSRLALRCSLVDLPNERKVHQQPVPRVGGIAMALGMVVPVFFWIGQDRFTEAFLAGAGVLLVFGLLDDCRELSPRWKLLGQVAAAAIAVLPGGIRITSLGMLAPEGFLLPGWFAIPFTIFVIVGVTNAINLSDGLDGLAGGISLLSLCCIGYLAYLQHRIPIGIIALALGGATFGFLRYNTYPATIFMGDVGSQLLGFSCITLALSLTQGATQLSPLLPLVILGFPILDTLTVMFGRIARGISPFSADKTHFHHTLLGLGLHHSESVMMIYLVQVTLITLAFAFRGYSDRLLLAGYLAFSVLVLAIFSRARKNNWQLKRMGPMAVVDGYFVRLRETKLITYLFRPLQAGLIAVLLLSALLSGTAPGTAVWSTLAAIAILLLIYAWRPRLLPDALKVTLYLVIPLIIYRSATRLDDSGVVDLVFFYRLCFWILALLNILVSRLTRRIHGFQSTPLDFLVLFIALASYRIPEALPEAHLPVFSLSLIAAKIIICYFSCEVIFAELRENIRPMALATLGLLAVLALQALL